MPPSNNICRVYLNTQMITKWVLLARFVITFNTGLNTLLGKLDFLLPNIFYGLYLRWICEIITTNLGTIPSSFLNQLILLYFCFSFYNHHKANNIYIENLRQHYGYVFVTFILNQQMKINLIHFPPYDTSYNFLLARKAQNVAVKSKTKCMKLLLRFMLMTAKLKTFC